MKNATQNIAPKSEWPCMNMINMICQLKNFVKFYILKSMSPKANRLNWKLVATWFLTTNVTGIISVFFLVTQKFQLFVFINFRCDMQFASAAKLYTHKRSSSRKKVHNCQNCEFKSCTKNGLLSHRLREIF